MACIGESSKRQLTPSKELPISKRLDLRPTPKKAAPKQDSGKQCKQKQMYLQALLKQNFIYKEEESLSRLEIEEVLIKAIAKVMILIVMLLYHDTVIKNYQFYFA